MNRKGQVNKKIYCNAKGSETDAFSRGLSIREQIEIKRGIYPVAGPR